MPIDTSKIKKNTKAKRNSKSFDLNEFLNKDIQLFGSKLNDKKKQSFYGELAVLIKAGITLKEALTIITQEQKKDKDKKLFNQIDNDLVSGQKFSETLLSSGAFSNYEYYSVQIGEETGTLTTVLEELASFYEKKVEQKRIITGALTYPFVVMITAFGAIFFMLRFVVPMFEDIFSRLGGDLPYLTKLVIYASEWLGSYYYLLFLFVFAFVVIHQKAKKYDKYQHYLGNFVLKIPIFGELMRKIYVTQFSQSLRLLNASSVPLLNSIELIQKMISFYPLKTGLKQIENEILLGHTLSEGMKKVKIFDNKMVSLIKVAEETNQLDYMFAKISEEYNKDVEHQSKLLSTIMEPLIIVFLGILVAIILIAMYLPMFQLSTTIQ